MFDPNRIVIVDDSPTTLAILRSLSAKVQGAATTVFTDALSALNYLALNPANLIVLDYSMPKMTGIELIKQLRTTQQHARTPIVMITGSSESAVRKRATDVGATAFMNKPVAAHDFRACLAAHLGCA